MPNPLRRVLRGAIDRALDYAAGRQELRDRTSPAVKIQLRNLWMTYRSMVEHGTALPSIWDTGFGVFSEYDEDGVILFLLSLSNGSRSFIDIGAGNGVHASNCANLAFNFGYHGLSSMRTRGASPRASRFTLRMVIRADTLRSS